MSLAPSNNLVMKPPPLPPKKIIRSAAHMNLPINLNNFPPPSPTLSSPDRTFNGITAFEHYDPQSPKIEPKKHIHICKKHRAQNKDSEILVIEDNVDSNESNCLEQKSIPVTNPKMCKRLAKIKPMMKSDQNESNCLEQKSIPVTNPKMCKRLAKIKPIMKSDQNEINDFAESNHADLKNRLISEIKNLNSGDKNVIFPDKSSLDQTSAYENIESKHLSKLTFSSNSDMSSSFCNGETQQVPSKAVRRNSFNGTSKAVRRNSFNGTQNEQPVTEKTKRKNSFNELKNVLKFGDIILPI
ncbi:uncharacterized protein LOC113470751 [Diaphorina citri]|uniref:Uncharacterized protein LOC113470751 n=1 Tax=Diaphorina citri TaxID=121845 RepID=A0A3Q0J9Y5_DIACI|nr:uncharacterized protein LOC113470751 [Diaphorina citri]